MYQLYESISDEDKVIFSQHHLFLYEEDFTSSIFNLSLRLSTNLVNLD